MKTWYKTIYVASESELMDQTYYRRLWLAAIPRREWLDAIADTLRDYRSTIAFAPGQRYQVPCIDAAIGNDLDVRWLGHFLAANDNGGFPLRYSRKIERLRLIDLYFRIRHPEIARHFHR